LYASPRDVMTRIFLIPKYLRLAGIVAGLFFASLYRTNAGTAIHPLIEGQGDAAEGHVERGLEFARTGNLESAELELRKAVELNRADATALSSLATVLAMEKKFDESTVLFTRALKINPGDLRSREYLAANLWQLHRYVEAKQNLKIILSANPADAQGKLLLGMVSENSGDYNTAATMLAAVPELTRGHPEATVALAKSYYHLGKRDQAADSLREIGAGSVGNDGLLLGAQVADEMQDYDTAELLFARIPPGSPEAGLARYRLALVKFHAGKYQESEAILQDLRTAGQETGDILRLLGWCYQRQNHSDQAMAIFREAVRLNSSDEQNFLDLGALLLENRSFGPALELAKRTADAFPASAKALRLLGSIQLASEQFTDAMKTYSSSLSLDSRSTTGILGLAKAQAGAGMEKEARMTMETASREFPRNAELELELALLLLKQDEAANANSQARAEQLLRAAAKHDPKLAEPQIQLGELELRRGEIKLALGHLQNAVRLCPESARAHFSLARGYRRAGRNEEAAKETALFDKLKKSEASRSGSPSPDTLLKE
jgi:tetratricopeptide (TPR) repeat protein